jgi:hypothetical protein
LLVIRCQGLFSGYSAAFASKFSLNRFSLLAFALLFGLNPASAFEIAPEFRGLDLIEAQSFDNPQKIDAEYQSDYLAFAPRLTEIQPRRQHSLSGSVGSLGAKDFMVRNDLKVQLPIDNNFELRLRHFYSSDLESVARHNIYEFIKYFSDEQKHGISLYGELTGDKKDVDAGAAYLFNTKYTNHRLYVFAPDFQRNKRNDESDRFKTKPYVFGYQLTRLLGQNGFQIFNVRYEAPTEWQFPATGRNYEYSRSHVSFEKSYGGHQTRIEYSNKFEKDDTESWRTERLLVDKSVEFVGSEAGLSFAHRKWHTTRKLTTRFYQPYLWLPLNQHWRAGAELTIPGVTGRIAAFKNPTLQTEARINFEWSHEITKDGAIIALLSLDGDEFGSSETWEGGNVRLSLGF